MKISSFLFALLFLSGTLFAQTGRDVSGVVQDTTGAAVFGATLKLVQASTPADTMLIRSNMDGIFTFKNVSASKFTISVSSLGYETLNISPVIAEGTSPVTLDKIILKAGSTTLMEVVINGAPPVTIKQDTIEYRTSDLKLKEGANVEDAIKRLDGAEVDKDGNVTAAGKPVTRIKVNGKEIFGGDMKTATKNIPADAIDKIQLIDDYGDQAAFTGVKDGDPETIINITTKPGRNHGVIANAAAGGGTEDRYQLGLFASQLEGDRTLGITANLNNNGTQIGGAGFGGRGGGGNFAAGGGGGIANVSSVGLSYNDRWSPKVLVTGAYTWYNTDRSTITNTLRQSANSLGIINSREMSDGVNLSNSHSFNARFQYNINPANLLVITPFVSFTNSRNDSYRSTFQTGFLTQDQITSTGNESYTPSLSGGVLFNHLFKKAGRNFSLNLNVRDSELNSDQDNDNHIVYYDASGNTLRDSINYRINTTANRTFSGSTRFIYSEPLSSTSRLQFSYNVNYNNYDNSKITSFTNPSGALVNIDSLSNVFQYSFLSNQIGLNYNYKDQKNDLSLGLTANPTNLSGSSASLNTTINRSNFYLAPIIRYQYKYSKTKSMMLNYFGSAAEPQFAQLQPVRDVSNPQRPVIGNPDLNSSFSHSLNANYNTSNPAKHTSFMLNFQGNVQNNQIVQNIVLVPDVYGSFKQEVRYVNADGYYTYFGSYNWQKSFNDRQYTIRFNGDTRYTNSISFADNIKNYSQRRNISQRMSLQINPGSWLELTPNLMYSYTTTNYSLPTNIDTKLTTYGFNVDGKLFFTESKSLILGFNAGKTFNTGYSGALNTNPLVVNTYVEKQFMKKAGAIRFQAFDLFNQSNNIMRTVTENGFTDVQTNRLTQYFMFTLSMKINKFAGVSPAAVQGENNQRGQPGQNGQRGQQGMPGGGGF